MNSSYPHGRRAVFFLFALAFCSFWMCEAALAAASSDDAYAEYAARPGFAPFCRDALFKTGVRYTLDIYRGMLPLNNPDGAPKPKQSHSRFIVGDALCAAAPARFSFRLVPIAPMKSASEIALSLGGHAPPRRSILRVAASLVGASSARGEPLRFAAFFAALLRRSSSSKGDLSPFDKPPAGLSYVASGLRAIIIREGIVE